jgi:hypothetical protein
MRTIPVPARIADQFKRLAALDEEAFEKLAAGAEVATPTLSPHALWHEIADKSGLDFETVQDLLEGVLSATGIGLRDGLGPAETARALRVDELASSREALDARMERLIATRAVSLTAKGLDLAVSDQKVLLRTRIVTDIRPVFSLQAGGEEPTQPPAAMVKHSLRLEYLEGNDSRTFVVSLDEVDVTRLRDAIERAERKARALSELIAASNMQELTIVAEDDE